MLLSRNALTVLLQPSLSMLHVAVVDGCVAAAAAAAAAAYVALGIECHRYRDC